MPIYEYQCKKCDEEFELLVQGTTAPECPHCQSVRLEKKLSIFSANGKPGGEHVHTGPGCGCGNPQGPCNN